MSASGGRAYDKEIEQHYRKIALDFGLSATSTMADEITRGLETKAILDFVRVALAARTEEARLRPATIIDVGCGNGYTLERLLERFPGQRFLGVEKSDELRALASSRFRQGGSVTIIAGDVRNPQFAQPDSADIIICQRVLINLLEYEDQKRALDNIVNVLHGKPDGGAGGKCLFIEAFSQYLLKLNEARAEFELPPIPPAHHNLYLPDDFFLMPQLRSFVTPAIAPANFLSTHYYVTRVLHPVVTANEAVKRNSEFVRFFSDALKPNVGDYSPLRLCSFEKISKISYPPSRP
ncbi:MAG: class I SAM-dependent methyltransferase [Gemmatimonadaceae bacterium]